MSTIHDAEQLAAAKAIRCIIFDVDGVLTDGSIVVNDAGEESKRFFVRDGLGIKAAMRVGMQVGVLTARSSRCVTLRMNELGIRLLQQGARNKVIGLETLCQQAKVPLEQCAYVGDDLVDLPALVRCGYPIAVADAVEEVKAVAKYVTAHVGGRGAARDAVEHLLKAQGRWDEVVESYGL